MRYSTLYDIREIKIKTRIIYHHTFIRITEIWNTDHKKCYRGYGATKVTICCWWECKVAQPLWETSVAVSYKAKYTPATCSGNQSRPLEFTQKSWKLCLHETSQRCSQQLYLQLQKGGSIHDILQRMNGKIKWGTSRLWYIIEH